MEILVLMSQKVTDAENDYAASAADDSEDNDSATAGGGSDATAVDADCDDSTVANVNCDDAGSADGSFGAGGGTDYSLYDTSSQSDCEDMTSQLSTARVMSPMKAVAAAPAAARKHAPAGASVSASAARAARKLAPAAAAAAPKAAAAVVAAAAAAAAPKPAATAAAAAAQAPQPAAAAAAAAVAVAVAAPAADKENAPPTNDNHHPNRRILSRSTALPAGFGGGMTALGRTRPMQRPESVVMPPPVSVPTAVFVVPAPVTPTVIPTPTAPVFDKSASFSVPGGATNAIPRPAIPQYAATGEVRRETLSPRATQELANNIYAAQQSLNEQGIGGSGALLQYLPKKNQIYEYPVFAPVQVPVTLTAPAAPAAPAPAESNRSYTTPPTQYSSGVGTYPAPGTVYAPQPAVTAYTNTSHYAPVQVYPHHAPPAVTAAVTAGSSMYHSRHHKNANSTASSTSYGYTGGMPVARYPPHRPNYAARIDAHTYGPATPHVFPASFQ